MSQETTVTDTPPSTSTAPGASGDRVLYFVDPYTCMVMARLPQGVSDSTDASAVTEPDRPVFHDTPESALLSTIAILCQKLEFIDAPHAPWIVPSSLSREERSIVVRKIMHCAMQLLALHREGQRGTTQE